MEKKLKKSGIALVSLTIIIIVLMLISGIVTYVSYDIMSEGKKTAFLHDVEVVNSAVGEYYAVNGSNPILSTGTQITASQYKQKINELYDENAAESLTQELTQNGDLEATFYEIDLAKLNVETSKFGVKAEAEDIFLISSNNNIYYYSGYQIANDIYFSNVKIMDKNN